MKLIHTSIVMLLALTCTAQAASLEEYSENLHEKAYQDIALDMCDCVEGAVEGMSERAKSILADFDGDSEKMQEDLLEYLLDEPEAGQKDMKVMAEMADEIAVCGDKLQKKFENVYSSESEEEVMKRLVEAINALDDDCAVTKSLINIGYESTK